MKLLPKNAEKNIKFELSARPSSQVFVAGTFNNWNPTASPMKDNPKSGHFKTSLRIPAGTHEYKFVVDGDWIVDPNSTEQIRNGHGTLNSLLQV